MNSTESFSTGRSGIMTSQSSLPSSSSSVSPPLSPQCIALSAPFSAIAEGAAVFRRIFFPSLVYTGAFVLAGILLYFLTHRLGLAPMVWALAGGFMLVGPMLLAGFFALARREREIPANESVRLADALAGFFRMPTAVWALALVCAFLFLVWITDIGILYSFMVGREHLPLAWESFIPLREHITAFYFWGSVMGAALAFILFSISAFSVPLLLDRRTTLVSAVSASVRAVFRNFLSCLVWALLLSAVTMTAVLLLPLLFFALPVMAYASEALYRRVFPGSVLLVSTP